jgi:site-specific DNA-methyltransferase (adenine-specific)/adenine-specific DNA-methyltransferase
MANLSDKDRDKIIKLLAEGRDLPTLFQQKLFESGEVDYVEATKDYKLIYKGKTPEARVIAETPAAPFQEIRSFNKDNPFGDNWANMLIFGDNLYALKTIYEDQRGANKLGTKNKIKLIYIDPPFATKQDFMKDREKAYRDKVIGAEFIEFLRKRLILMREILADDGTIYVHLDWRKGHYIKAVLDEIFGEHNFLNHIAWCYKEREISYRQYNAKHDYILFYSKNKNNGYTFNWKEAAQKYSAGSIAKYNLIDEDERAFQIRGGGGHLTGKQGLPLEYEKKYPDWVYRDYLDEKEGIAPRDWWSDIPFANRAGFERKVTGNYPNQKSEKLLERIIKVSSKSNDIVLDAFMGSGTTLAVAEKLERRWIGMDCGKLAVYTAQKRLLNLTTQIGSTQIDERRDYERVEDFDAHSKSGARGLFMIYEKARAGDLDITDDFLISFGKFINTYIAGRNEETFSLVCPQNKFKVKELKVIENNPSEDNAPLYDGESAGQKVVKIDRVKFLVSFVKPKEKNKETEHLKAKHFKLLNAGTYDNELILRMDWEQYKPFVAQLFNVRLSPHKIKAFEVDGYIDTYSTYIWNYPDNKTLEIDEEYVNDFHKALGGRGGDKFYVVAPINAMRFMQDEIKKGDTTCKDASKIDPLDSTNFDPTLGTFFYNISTAL